MYDIIFMFKHLLIDDLYTNKDLKEVLKNVYIIRVYMKSCCDYLSC